VISGGSRNRWRASRIIETHSAIRKTALKKAPRISARSHWGKSVQSYKRVRKLVTQVVPTYAISVLVRCGLSGNPNSPKTNAKRNDVVQHVEGVGHEGEGVDEEAGNELEEEEDDVDAQHNADACRFGPRHDCGGGCQLATAAVGGSVVSRRCWLLFNKKMM